MLDALSSSAGGLMVEAANGTTAVGSSDRESVDTNPAPSEFVDSNDPKSAESVSESRVPSLGGSVAAAVSTCNA